MKRKFLAIAAATLLVLGVAAPATAFENSTTDHVEVTDPTLPSDQKNYVTKLSQNFPHPEVR